MGPHHQLAAIVLVCGVALTAAALETQRERDPGASPAMVLGVAHEDGARWLVQVDPLSLRPLPRGRLRLRAPLEAWASSPEGRRLAAVTDGASVLQVLDVARMRVLGRMRLPVRGSPAAVVWTRRERVWVVVTGPAAEATTVVTIDPRVRRVVARRRISGGLVRVAASPDGPVLLVGPPALIGPSRLVTVDGAGAVEQVPLDGVSAGVMPTGLGPSIKRVRRPALVVDPTARRAYVLPSRPHIVEVDLRRRRATGHRLVARTSLVDRLRELVVPSAAADAEVGPVREAAWVGEGRIVLSGYDGDAVWRVDDRIDGARRPAGLHVVDTRDWSLGTLDERAFGFVAAAGLVLTSGENRRGLTAYTPDGDERFRVLDGRRAEVVASAGSLAYVRTPVDPALQVLDVARGRMVGTSAPGRATLLLERAARSR